MPEQTIKYDLSEFGLVFHIKPERPIALKNMLKGLKAVGNEHSLYCKNILKISRQKRPKLFIKSIKPGSIDILLQPEIIAQVADSAVGMAALESGTYYLSDFAQRLYNKLKGFGKPPSEKFLQNISMRDCDNAINIGSINTNAGGITIININQPDGTKENIGKLSAHESRQIVDNASKAKASLKLPESKRFTHVALVWKTFEKSQARTKGTTSPDKGIIKDIAPNPKAIFFDEKMSEFKESMLKSEDNFMKKIYYVDAEIRQVQGKIRAYIIVNYHSEEDI